MGKTEQRLLEQLTSNVWGFTSAHGAREMAAARKLEAKGLAVIEEFTTPSGHFNRDWVWVDTSVTHLKVSKPIPGWGE